MARRHQRGFTLTEVIITVLIVAIMASIAIPQYGKTVRRSHWRSTRDLLQVVYSGQQVYWTANNTYKVCAIPADWAAIYVDDPNTGSEMPVTLAVATNGAIGAAATFTATATYTPTGETQTVNQTRTFGGTWAMP